MAKSVNKVILIGNLGGQVPEFRDHGNGFVTATFMMATTEEWRDRESRERRERTDWHRIEASGRLAEIIRDILTAGNELVYVEGKLNTDRVERKDQPGKFDYFTKVRAEDISKLSKRERGETGDDAQGDERHGDEGDSSGEAPAAGASSASAPAAGTPAASAASSPARAGGASKWRDRGRR